MRKPTRIATGIASVALAVGAGAGLADAAQLGGGDKAGADTAEHRGPPGATAIAEYLGLTAAELRTRLEAGTTLADIAKAQGKTVKGLEDAIVADAKSHLDAAVADGRLTAAQASARLEELESRVDDMVNRTGPPLGGPGEAGHGFLAPGAVADYLGLTAAQLRTQLEAGKSLADIAKAQGKTVTGLEDAIVAATKKRLDADVAAGRLTAAQASSMLDDLESRVDDMVNRTGPPPGGPNGRGGPGDSAGRSAFGPLVRL